MEKIELTVPSENVTAGEVENEKLDDECSEPLLKLGAVKAPKVDMTEETAVPTDLIKSPLCCISPLLFNFELSSTTDELSLLQHGPKTKVIQLKKCI